MIKDDQHIRQSVQRRENLGQPLFVRVRRVLLKRLHPLRARVAGQIVDAEMERLIPAIGRAPLHGNRNMPRPRRRSAAASEP